MGQVKGKRGWKIRKTGSETDTYIQISNSRKNTLVIYGTESMTKKAEQLILQSINEQEALNDYYRKPKPKDNNWAPSNKSEQEEQKILHDKQESKGKCRQRVSTNKNYYQANQVKDRFHDNRKEEVCKFI